MSPHRHGQPHPQSRHDADQSADPPMPCAVEILSTIAFGGFSIAVSAMTFAASAMGGFAVSVLLAMIWLSTLQRRTGRQMLGTQILSVLLFAGFSISVTAMAFAAFWPGGVGLALAFAWGWNTLLHARDLRARRAGRDMKRRASGLAPEPETFHRPAPTGNASFDSYRDEMLHRLEEEQEAFEGFLARLRAARDQGEFDSFMDDRADARAAERAAAEAEDAADAASNPGTGLVSAPIRLPPPISAAAG